MTLQETVVAPRQNYQGIIFLKTDRGKEELFANNSESFRLDQLLKESKLKVRIAVTDVETSERIHFGPFSLTGL